MSNDEGRRRALLQVVDWWESDRSRLLIIRVVAFGLFVASVAGTVYSGVKGFLPAWALTLYAAFTVQLVFMTFMYAIRHSGKEEIRKAIFDLRRSRIEEWRFHHNALAEYARLTACQAASMDPSLVEISNRRMRRTHVKAPWPAVPSKELEARRIVHSELLGLSDVHNEQQDDGNEHQRSQGHPLELK